MALAPAATATSRAPSPRPSSRCSRRSASATPRSAPDEERLEAILAQGADKARAIAAGHDRRRPRRHGRRGTAAVRLAPPVRRLTLLVGAIVLVDTMFYAAITPLLPKLVDDLDLGKNGAGVLTGAYAAGTLLGSLPGGWADRARGREGDRDRRPRAHVASRAWRSRSARRSWCSTPPASCRASAARARGRAG